MQSKMLNMLILTLKNKSFSLHGTFRNKFTKLPAIRLKNSACLIALKSYEKGGKNCLLIAYSGLFFIFIGLTSFKKKNKKTKQQQQKQYPLFPNFIFSILLARFQRHTICRDSSPELSIGQI